MPDDTCKRLLIPQQLQARILPSLPRKAYSDKVEQRQRVDYYVSAQFAPAMGFTTGLVSLPTATTPASPSSDLPR